MGDNDGKLCFRGLLGGLHKLITQSVESTAWHVAHTPLCSLAVLSKRWRFQAAAELCAGASVWLTCLLKVVWYFPPVILRDTFESILCVHIPSFCAIRKKGVGYGSKPWGGGKWDKVFHVDGVRPSKRSVSDPQGSSCSISGGPARHPCWQSWREANLGLAFWLRSRVLLSLTLTCTAFCSPSSWWCLDGLSGAFLANVRVQVNMQGELCVQRAELLQRQHIPT